jgi:methylmalonyl-CoA/ethylmalonyl-CoA epimerase
MKLLRVNHLGIAPKDPQATARFFTECLGIQAEGEERVEEQKVAVSFYPVDDTRLELLTATAPDSPVAKFIETKGGGVQHFALEVDDVGAWMKHLKSKGVRLINEEPRIGAHNTKICFVHPASTGGVLIELVEENKGAV